MKYFDDVKVNKLSQYNYYKTYFYNGCNKFKQTIYYESNIINAITGEVHG